MYISKEERLKIALEWYNLKLNENQELDFSCYDRLILDKFLEYIAIHNIEVKVIKPRYHSSLIYKRDCLGVYYCDSL